jgi:CRP-like cAMP-binding protein
MIPPSRDPGSEPGRDPSRWPPGTLVGQLSSADRSALLDAGTVVTFGDEDTIVRQGDKGNDLFVLLRGLVKIRVAMENGANTVLDVLSRGDLVGEFALLDGSPRNATAIAMSDVSALRVAHAAFTKVIKDHPLLQSEITKSVVAKMRASTDRRAADRFLSARARLASALYDLATTRLEPDPDGVYRLPMTQAALGELAGVGQSTAERELSKLRDQGAIETRYRLIEIRDLPYLARIRFSS